MSGSLMDPGGLAPQIGRGSATALNTGSAVSVHFIGAPGCGKTSLIQTTIGRLQPGIRAGVMTAEPVSDEELQRLARGGHQALQIEAGIGGSLDSVQIQQALGLLDLKSLDLLFIENGGAMEANVGEDVAVSVFSAAAGDDRAATHPDLARSADIVVLNKIDLLARIPFDGSAFRSNVRRLNPDACVIELSLLRGQGVERWLGCLACGINARRPREAPWFL